MRTNTLVVLIAIAMLGVCSPAMAGKGGGGGGGGKGGSGMGHMGHVHFGHNFQRFPRNQVFFGGGWGWDWVHTLGMAETRPFWSPSKLCRAFQRRT